MRPCANNNGTDNGQCPHREKRGWTGDSLAAHRAVSSFFDMRAAWTKWVDDMLLSQSMLLPAGAMPTIVPCVYSQGQCRDDPRMPPQWPGRPVKADVAWGSVLPLLAAHTAKLTSDARFAARAAAGAAAYVSLLHSHADNASASTFPGLLNYTNWPGHLGDWCPAVGDASVSTLLNSHHLILDTDAAVALLQQGREHARGLSLAAAGPSEAELTAWAKTARESFVKAFLRNVTVPGTAPPPTLTCGTASENAPLELSCPAGQTISRIVFAGYGVPAGTCATGLRPSEACYLDIRTQVSAKCAGKPACSVECDLSPGPSERRLGRCRAHSFNAAHQSRVTLSLR